MNFEAQDSAKLIILMVAGGAFAGVGLWLLLRPKSSGSSAKIELFGLKFESSSAGLLVFLIGAVFLAIPLFVPEKSGFRTHDGEAGDMAPTDLETVPRASNSGRLAVVLPDRPGAEEVEPNERVQEANQLMIGATVAGKMRKGDADWYVIPVQDHIGSRLIVTLRHVSGGGLYGELFGSDERRKAQMSTGAGADVDDLEVSGPVAYVRIQTGGGVTKASQYELTTRVEEF